MDTRYSRQWRTNAKQQVGAAGGAHAPANAEDVVPGAAGCRGRAAGCVCDHRAGLTSARSSPRPGGNRQNLHRSRHRRIHEGHVHWRCRPIGGFRIRPAPGNRRRREALGAQRLAYHPVRGRDPSIQSQPAGCASPCGGEPHRGAGGCHHREPVFRSELRADQPFARSRSQGGSPAAMWHNWSTGPLPTLAGWTACISSTRLPAALSCSWRAATAAHRLPPSSLRRACSNPARARPAVITKAQVESATPHRALPYDKNKKDMHYDIISPSSDPCAAPIPMRRCIGSPGYDRWGRGPQIYRPPYAHPRV